MKKLFYLVSFCLSLSSLKLEVHAGVNEALAAIQNKNYAVAFSKLKPLAKQGNSSAQYNLGIMYFRGLGVSKDTETALELFSRAANADNVLAQYFLGYIHEHGRQVRKNYKTALIFYKLAAGQGHPASQVNLGAMHYFGNGTPKSNLYAYMWWSIASIQVEGAEENLKLIKKNMTPKELDQGRRLVSNCIKKNYKGC